MSYCRKGKDSDVYLTRCFGGGWTCYSCELNPEKSYKLYLPEYSRTFSLLRRENTELKQRRSVLKHLLDHKKAGHKVPKYALARIRRQLKEKW